MGERPMINNSHKTITNWHRIIYIVVLCLFVIGLPQQSDAQGSGKGKTKKKAEWVYLDHADDLKFDQATRPGVQIAKGNVRFRFEDNTLSCDSAFFNQISNTFDAMGHVKMHRGTGNVSLSSVRASYNSLSKIFTASKHVVMTQPGNSLHCDSLVYNVESHTANYYGNGRLSGNGATVTSEQGDYNTKTHAAHFTGHRVVLHSPEYTVTTPSLNYNTQTKKGHVQGKSVIRTAAGEVVHTDNADFDGISHGFTTHGHSTVTSRERDIEGDNMTYDRSTGRGEGHGHVKVVDKQGGRTITGDNVKFRTANVYKNGKPRNEVVAFEGDGHSVIVDRPAQRTTKGDYLSYNAQTKEGYGKGHVDYIDHLKKNAFLGDYVHYTELHAIAYGHAIVKDFSQSANGDTLFVHADTLKMRGKVVDKPVIGAFSGDTLRMEKDTVRTFYGIGNVRAFRSDVQAVCGLLVGFTGDSTMTMYQDPIVWTGQRQLVGDSIRCFMNDSTIREAHVMGNAMSIEQMPDGEHYNQISSKRIYGYFVDGKIRCSEAFGNVLVVFYPVDDKDSSLIGLNYTETDTMRAFMSPDRKLQKIWMPKSSGTLYPMNQIPADKLKLQGFAWYDYIRPLDKHDIFRHASKGDKSQQRQVRISPPPLQYVGGKGHNGRNGNAGNTATVVTSSGTRRQIVYPATPVVHPSVEEVRP